jgi:hypothetical protein
MKFVLKVVIRIIDRRWNKRIHHFLRVMDLCEEANPNDIAHKEEHARFRMVMADDLARWHAKRDALLVQSKQKSDAGN